jgi:hypothetical protein
MQSRGSSRKGAILNQSSNQQVSPKSGVSQIPSLNSKLRNSEAPTD